MKILEQVYVISSPFNKDMAMKALDEQLGSVIFDELIAGEKESLTLRFIIEDKED